jgi:hypothetical protein
LGAAVAIAAGYLHSLAIRADGTVAAWGDNGYGQTNVPAGLSNVVAIAAGFSASLALKADGTVVAWGSGVGTNVPTGLRGVIAISCCGRDYYPTENCAALKSDGTVVTWGAGAIYDEPTGLSNVVAIATGGEHVLALRSDGSLVAWGNNCYGQCNVPGTYVSGGDLQGAVAHANDGDTVMVRPGHYDLTNQIVVTNAIVLRSTTGPDQTFLNIRFDDYGLRVSNSQAVVDGLTLRGAPHGCYSVYGSAANIFLVGATVQNCRFENHLTRTGASVFMLGGLLSNSVVTYTFTGSCIECPAVYCGAGGLITDCSVNGAFAGGTGPAIGIYLDHSQLRNSLVSGVLGYAVPAAGGWAVEAHMSTIVGCTITPTLWTSSGARLDNSLMDRCVVAHCTSTGCGLGTGGGGIFETNSLVLNSVIFGNRAVRGDGGCDEQIYGGGVYMQSGALVNCTVAWNSAGSGSGVFIESGSLTNCIVYSYFPNYYLSNVDNWVKAGPGVFDHCCTTPDPGGEGNLVLDPEFASPTNGDFRLLPSSACLRAGVVQDRMSGAFDLNGNPRTVNGAVDIGAYETLSVQDRAEELMGAVMVLVQQGGLRQGQAAALIAKLEAAEKSMNAGHMSAACHHVDVFLGQVDALVQQGALTSAQGQALTNNANALKAALGCQ